VWWPSLEKNCYLRILFKIQRIAEPSTSTIRYPLLSLVRDQREMEICKEQSEINKRHLPAVDRFMRYGR